MCSVKGKGVPMEAMKVYSGSGGMVSHIHDLGTMWRSGQPHTPGRFTLGEIARGTHWIGGLFGLRTGLGFLENSEFLFPYRNLDRRFSSP